MLIKSSCFLFLALALGLVSCVNDPEAQVKVPDNILSEDSLAKVLVDFALAESASNLNILAAPLQRLDTVYAFDPLAEHHLSQGKYDSSLLFYANHPELYKKVYENVLAALSEMQTTRDTLKKDSLGK